MGAHLIDLRQAERPAQDNLAGLQACLAPLVGEPFHFARVSYGDELTLHFGDLRPARSPKLEGKLYGTYILDVRASPWILKAGAEPLVVTAGEVFSLAQGTLGTPLTKEALENGELIESGSRVLTITPFVVKPAEAFGLQLRMSDGSTLNVLPTVHELDEPEDAGLPELADWELSSPRGLLSAGPSLVWSFRPAISSATEPSAELKS